MKKYFAATLCLLGFAYCNAQQKKPIDNKSLLWKITGKNIKKPSFLFGTIHMLCQDDYIWTPAMETSLKRANEVCFEMDMDDPNMMVTVTTGMIDASGKTLKDYFTTEQYAKIDQYVTDSLGMSLDLFQQMKPVALQSLFATSAVSCTNTVSYEAKIMEKAQQQKKEVTGLEEASEQLALFDSLPIDSVVADLLETVSQGKAQKDEYALMLAAYKKQDLPALYALINEAGGNGLDLGKFLTDRNEKWIVRMEERMEQKSIFFAVGAGHLWGDKGVIQLLKEQGYDVTPLK